MPAAECRLTPKAIDDLHTIWEYLASVNERGADALLDRIHEKIVSTLRFRSPDRHDQASARGPGFWWSASM